MNRNVSARWSSVRISTMSGRLGRSPRGAGVSPSADEITGKAVANDTMATNNVRLRILVNIGSTSLVGFMRPTLGRGGHQETRGTTRVCDTRRGDPCVVVCREVTYVTRRWGSHVEIERSQLGPRSDLELRVDVREMHFAARDPDGQRPRDLAVREAGGCQAGDPGLALGQLTDRCAAAKIRRATGL